MAASVETPPYAVRSLVADVVAEMSEQLDESATVLSDVIHAACPELSLDLYMATRQSTRANLGLVTTMIAEGAAPSAFAAAPEETLAYARTYVHEGLSFDLLTRVYHEWEHAYARLWRETLQVRASTPRDLGDALTYIEDWLFAYVQAMAQRLGAAYGTERAQWVRGSVAVRSEEVRAILSGARIDMIEASSRLRYRLEANHLAIVIFRRHPSSGDRLANGARPFHEMAQLTDDIARSRGASSVLSLPMAGFYAAWLAVGDDVLASALPGLPSELQVALGRPGAGLEGFRRSHHEALQARRISQLSGRSPAALDYGAVTLEALLTHDVAEARRFVHDQLGPLLDDSEANRRVLRTLEVYLEEDASFVRAARRLGVHGNTVAYRVKRAEHALSRMATDSQLELRTALRLAHLVL
jgi:hypothetical protein